MKVNMVKLMVTVLCLASSMACNPKSDDQASAETESAMADEAVISESQSSTASTTTHSYDVSGKDTITLASGLKYILVKEGSGPKPTPGKTVSVHYTGYLTDGTKFDSSVDRGEPIKFPLGTGQVIKGWDEGIALLNVGSKAHLIIPHELGYGTEGYPPLIPPSATIIFDVELVGAE